MQRRATLVAVLVLISVAAFAAKKQSQATSSYFPLHNPVAGSGVSGDDVIIVGSQVQYTNLVGGVQSYLGAGGKDIDLVTYATGRNLHFEFPGGAVLAASSLAASANHESDFYGVNYFGTYDSMGIGTTAQIHGVLQFHVGALTYQLDYPALAAYRISATTWQISSNFLDFGIGAFDPGFSASNHATLSLVRQRGNLDYGVVAMPINFKAVLQ